MGRRLELQLGLAGGQLVLRLFKRCERHFQAGRGYLSESSGPGIHSRYAGDVSQLSVMLIAMWFDVWALDNLSLSLTPHTPTPESTLRTLWAQSWENMGKQTARTLPSVSLHGGSSMFPGMAASKRFSSRPAFCFLEASPWPQSEWEWVCELKCHHRVVYRPCNTKCRAASRTSIVQDIREPPLGAHRTGCCAFSLGLGIRPCLLIYSCSLSSHLLC